MRCPQRITQNIHVHAPTAEKKPYAALRELFPDGTGPDVCIEAVGLHYTNSWLHWFEVRVGAGGTGEHSGAAAVSLRCWTAGIHLAARCRLLVWHPVAPDTTPFRTSSVTVTYRPP